MRLNTFFEIIRISVKQRLAYRADYIFDILVGPLLFVVIQVVWVNIYAFNGVSEINGFSLVDSVTYFAISQLISHLIFSDILGDVGQIIKRGDFSMYALRPIGFFENKISELLGRKMASAFIRVPVLTLLLFLLFNLFVNTNPLTLLLFLISIVLSFFIYSSFMFALGMLTFWQESYWILQMASYALVGFLSGNILPLDFYPAALRTVVEVLPFKSIFYSPIMIYLGKYTLIDTLVVLAQQAISLFVFYLLAKFLLNVGKRKFTSQGG